MFRANSNPWVTFCMTTYNRPEFLKKQLTAINKQTYTDFLVVISDNASSDDTKKIVEDFNDPRFCYYANGENLGMVKSFNKSLERSASEFVVMITDDDFIYPDMLQTLYDLYSANPGYGMYIGSHDVFYSKLWLAKLSNVNVGIHSGLAQREIGEVEQYTSSEFISAFLQDRFGGGILWSAGIVRRDIAIEIGGVPDYGSPFMMDCSYVLLSGSKAGAVFINKALASLSLHGENYSYIETSYENLSRVPDAFYTWTMDHLANDIKSSSFQKMMEDYIGRSLIVYFIFLKKIFLQRNTVNKSFEDSMKNVFQIPYMRKWRLKYNISSQYPKSFQIFVNLKKVLLS